MNTFERLQFYRGVSGKYQTDQPYLMTPRQHRRPRNTPELFHEIADAWFKRNFGVAYRSEGLFVMSRLLSAMSYAATPEHVVRIVPLSEYSYCWSPKISDLLFVATGMATATHDEIDLYMNSAGYREDNLQEAHEMGHEVMLYCTRYIAIPVGLIGEAVESDTHSIILP